MLCKSKCSRNDLKYSSVNMQVIHLFWIRKLVELFDEWFKCVKSSWRWFPVGLVLLWYPATEYSIQCEWISGALLSKIKSQIMPWEMEIRKSLVSNYERLASNLPCIKSYTFSIFASAWESKKSYIGKINLCATISCLFLLTRAPKEYQTWYIACILYRGLCTRIFFAIVGKRTRKRQH